MHGGEEKDDEAIADFTVALRLEPNDFVAWLNRSVCYFHKKEYWQAIHDATMAINRGFPREDAYLQRAASHACLGNYAMSLADYDAAAAQAPQNAAVFIQRSAVYAMMGKKDKAAADWARAKQLRPALTEQDRALIPDPPKPPKPKTLTDEQTKSLAKALADFHRAFRANDESASQTAAEKAVEIDPTNAEARANRARLWSLLGRRDEALAEANEALRLDPKQAWAYFVRGAVNNGRNKRSPAIAELNMALELDSTIALAWSERGWAYFHRQQYRQAIHDLTEAIKRNAPADLGLANRGLCYLHLGEYEKARTDFAKAIEAFPTDAEMHMTLAAIDARLGNIDEWRRQRELAAKIEPKLKDSKDVELPPVEPAVKMDPEAENAPGSADRDKLARLLDRGRRMLADTRYEEMARAADGALAIDPQSPGALALRDIPLYQARHRRRPGRRRDSAQTQSRNAASLVGACRGSSRRWQAGRGHCRRDNRDSPRPKSSRRLG